MWYLIFHHVLSFSKAICTCSFLLAFRLILSWATTVGQRQDWLDVFLIQKMIGFHLWYFVFFYSSSYKWFVSSPPLSPQWHGVHPSSRLPVTCTIYTTVHWSCSGSSYWPNVLDTSCCFFLLMCHPPLKLCWLEWCLYSKVTCWCYSGALQWSQMIPCLTCVTVLIRHGYRHFVGSGYVCMVGGSTLVWIQFAS